MSKKEKYDFYCEEALTGKTPIKKLYESDGVLAFYHTKPSYKTHIVIVPRMHIRDVLHLTGENNELIVEMFRVVRQLAKKLDIDNNGARLITNMGKFQDTPHLHFHLVSGNKIS